MRKFAKGQNDREIRVQRSYCFSELRVLDCFRLQQRKMMAEGDFFDGCGGELLAASPRFVRAGCDADNRIAGIQEARQTGDSKFRCPHEENAWGGHGV
jgi:hypothetical protein